MSRLSSLRPGLWRSITLNGVISSPMIPMPLRWRLLRAFGASVDKSRISPGIWFGSRRFSIGRGSYINTKCMFSTHAPNTIGRDVYLGIGVSIVTSTHKLGPSGKRVGDLVIAPVTIGDGSWVGANCTMLPGVTIGPGVVVAAGSVVTSDCEPDSLYAGVPARKKRDLDLCRRAERASAGCIAGA